MCLCMRAKSSLVVINDKFCVYSDHSLRADGALDESTVLFLLLPPSLLRFVCGHNWAWKTEQRNSESFSNAPILIISATCSTV